MKTKLTVIVLTLVSLAASARAQPSSIRYGSRISPDVKLVYERGLKYLATTQQEDGSWAVSQQGGGITGLGLMALLASGEDPNFGRYADNIRRATRNIILSQDSSTGFIASTMYHHGFAMLALSEAYGAVDDAILWDDSRSNQRSIGVALELAVRCAITSQKKNQLGGWRYSPTAHDADASVSGAVLVGLLAARNAGIEVPDEAMDKALTFYRSSTSDSGMVSYKPAGAGPGTSMPRSSIGTLVMAIGKKKKWKEYRAALGHITKRVDHNETNYPHYYRYYVAQALFQGDFEAWTKWNRENTRMLRETQNDDGSFTSGHGNAYGTSMSLLSLALNYRFLLIYER